MKIKKPLFSIISAMILFIIMVVLPGLPAYAIDSPAKTWTFNTAADIDSRWTKANLNQYSYEIDNGYLKISNLNGAQVSASSALLTGNAGLLSGIDLTKHYYVKVRYRLMPGSDNTLRFIWDNALPITYKYMATATLVDDGNWNEIVVKLPEQNIAGMTSLKMFQVYLLRGMNAQSVYHGGTIYLDYIKFYDYDPTISTNKVTLIPQGATSDDVVLTGEGNYKDGSSVTITAKVNPDKNYVFEKWVDEAGKLLSSNPEYTLIINRNTTCKAVFIPQYTVSVVSNDASLGSTSAQGGLYKYGEMLSLTATPYKNNEFVCWEDNGRVVSTSCSYSFRVAGTHNIKAIFAESRKKYRVTFKDAGGRILKIEQVKKGSAATAPDEPAKAGYVFAGWNKPFKNITGDTVITATYKQDTITYSVNITNATFEGLEGKSTENFNYDSQVKLIPSTAPEGQKFSHWTKDGKIASYNKNYSFYVTGNTTAAAIFVPLDSIVKKTPVITIDSNPIAEKGQITFAAQYTVDGEVFHESSVAEYGILLSQNDNPDLGTLGVIRGKGCLKTSTGQFMITKTNASGQTWYGRAYLVYRDSSNNLITVYSNTVNAAVPD